MKKRFISIALGAALVAAPVVAWTGSPAEAGGSKISPPPDCGSHVACKGDPKPQPQSPVVIDDECARHIRCPDGGDNGVDPTPDDGCPIGRPCNYDAPGYEHPGAPDVPPPDDIPGKRVEESSTKSKTSKPKADASVDEAPAPRAVTAQPRTVG